MTKLALIVSIEIINAMCYIDENSSSLNFYLENKSRTQQ